MTNISTFDLWVKADADLASRQHSEIVAHIPVLRLSHGIVDAHFERPFKPLPPVPGRQLPEQSPKGLKLLYRAARSDLLNNGVNPDDFYLYVLWQSGDVPPHGVFREGHWHSDFLRNLRAENERGELPVTISYAVSTAIPTVVVTGFPSSEPLPLRETLLDFERLAELGQAAEDAGMVMQPQPGDVIRYDNFVVHKAAENPSDQPVFRILNHIAFSRDAIAPG